MNEQLELFRLPPPVSGTAARTQHIVIAGHIVEFELRRDRRRLAMRIDERGLRVGAPRGVALADIEAFIQSHGAWVLEKLEEFAQRVAPRHVPIHDGARLPVLGEEVRICVTEGGNRGYWQAGELWLAVRPDADLAAVARRALQRRALDYFRPRLADYAARAGRPVPALGLSAARTRWGSCSARSGIRLNWRLVHLPTELVDYVIAHEVAHLLEMNHSARFWAVVEELYPDCQAARAELKRQGSSLPLI